MGWRCRVPGSCALVRLLPGTAEHRDTLLRCHACPCVGEKHAAWRAAARGVAGQQAALRLDRLGFAQEIQRYVAAERVHDSLDLSVRLRRWLTERLGEVLCGWLVMGGHRQSFLVAGIVAQCTTASGRECVCIPASAWTSMNNYSASHALMFTPL